MSTQEQMDYKPTINLPKTDFPMKAALTEREPERLARWESSRLYDQILANRADAPDFSLHDGPPYANGNIHIGHALNKILKDLVTRYKSMAGFRSYYVPGFDCHGLPIEQKVLSDLKGKAATMSPAEIRALCHAEAVKWIGVQIEQFKRLGIQGDWDHPYRTLDHDVEVGILQALRDMIARGFVRKGFKPVLWDPVYRTALAEAEIEYATHVSDSIYVKFPLIDSESVPGLAGLANVSLVIWTTTPWTLPANLAVSLNPDFEYVVIGYGDEHYIVARGLAEAFIAACKLSPASVVATVNPRDLERKTAQHPIFDDKTSLIILGEHVTLEAGTGAVHTAPGHGVDDFNVGKRYGLDVFVPVDGAGNYTEDYPAMQGVNIFKANPEIVELLRASGLLVGHSKYEHQYPHSWRSHKPVIFRATAQWFIELDTSGIREKALKAIDEDVQWIPAWGRDRIFNMVTARPEWCLSRQRAWGVPIPSIRSKQTGDSVLDIRIVEKLMERVATSGTDVWFTEPLEAFWPEGFVYEPTGENKPEDFEKEFDIVDVWFDSGSTHIAVLEKREGLSSPAAMYLEGSDQHRGWFQSSLLIGIGTRDCPPFKNVLTHGFILDGKGEAMSKSKGNVISPAEIIKEMGADGLRLWVVSEDYRADMKISKDILKRVSEAYRRIRNTFRFLLGNISDFDPAQHALPVDQLDGHDRYTLAQLNELIEKVGAAFESYEYHRIYHLAHNFCAVTLSARYLDMIKDRMYCSAPADATRRSAQTTSYAIAQTLARLLAPVLVFTMDEVWEFGKFGPESSVHLADFPKPNPQWAATPELNAKWERLLDAKSIANVALERAREEKTIGNSLDAAVTLTPRNDEEREFLTKNLANLKYLFIVSQVEIEASNADSGAEALLARVVKASGGKCERCWTIDPEVGRHAGHPGLCPRCVDVVKRVT